MNTRTIQIANDIHVELDRIRSTVEPNAAVRVTSGMAQYVTETPNADRYYDTVVISEWMGASKMAGYLREVAA